ncbi:MAG: nucleoside monophosphate kinase [bacterium]
MNKQSVISVYGPPGSGKGTQAHKLADNFGFEHIDTGRVIEKKVHNPDLYDDPIIQREKKNFDDGILCTPEWVFEIVMNEIKEIHKLGKGILFSGSPRTLPEVEKMAPYLEDLYGKENIYILRLNINPETSIFRNSHRRICEKCGQSIFYSPENEKLEQCPKCNGRLVIRTLDKPETIKVRLEEYEQRTKPVHEFLKKRGIKVIDIDGEPPIEQVYQNILKVL